jgi:ATP-dependent Clp protease adaptor protein ClpS
MSQHSPLYNVVLLDDDVHTYAYVMEMLQTLLGCPSAWAFEMASEVDSTGRVIVDSTTQDRAISLQKQIHSYGADWRIPRCKGSMTALVEPAA